MATAPANSQLMGSIKTTKTCPNTLGVSVLRPFQACTSACSSCCLSVWVVGALMRVSRLCRRTTGLQT